MFHDAQKDKWHGVFVVTGDEERVRERIRFRLRDKLNAVVPKRKLMLRKSGIWKAETKVLFPGYVLLNGEIDTSSYYLLKNIPGILRLLKTGDVIASIESHEMAVLSRLICNGEEIGFSGALLENGRVRIIDGPLLSLEGIILNIDRRKERAKVRLTFLGEERTVDLGLTILRPA